MSLLVEDGTGLAEAESYVSVADFKAYCDARGYDYSGSADGVLEQKLRQATQWIDTRFEYSGTRLVASGALEFPRSGLVDDSGHEAAGVPRRVKHACSELAFIAIGEPLYQNAARGGKVVSESVGPISVSYAADAPADKRFAVAERLLAPFVQSTKLKFMAPVTSSEASTTGYFELDGMANPGAADAQV